MTEDCPASVGGEVVEGPVGPRSRGVRVVVDAPGSCLGGPGSKSRESCRVVHLGSPNDPEGRSITTVSGPLRGTTLPSE